MTELISHLSLLLALGGYAIASGLFLHAFPKPIKRQRVQQLAFCVFSVSAAMVATALTLSLMDAYYEHTSGLVLVVTLSVFTIFAYLRYQIKLLGLLVGPLATLILMFLAFQYHTAVNHDPASYPPMLLGFHIMVAIMGQSFAIMAFGISCFYLFQQRALKRKQLNFISSSTPPLHKLEGALMLCLWLGFVCLSLSLMTGAIYFGFFSQITPQNVAWKIGWAIMVWLWYLAILLAKNVLAQPGSRLARMSIMGFSLLLLTFFGLSNWQGGA